MIAAAESVCATCAAAAEIASLVVASGALATAGIGLWHDKDPKATSADISDMLALYGYDVDNNPLSDVVSAFQRHFRSARFDGVADDETCARLVNLLTLVAGDAAIS